MKFSILSISILCSIWSYSQIDKGQWIAGGNGAFSYSQSDKLKIIHVALSPAAGYFFLPKTIVGLRTSFASQTDRWSSKDKNRWTDYSLSPFLRYYFLPADRNLNLLADLSFGFGRGKYKDFFDGNSYSYSFYSYSINAGPAVFLNEHTALELIFGYKHSSRGEIDTTIKNKFQLGIGLQFHFGNKKD